jgi:hypothetical protein
MKTGRIAWLAAAIAPLAIAGMPSLGTAAVYQADLVVAEQGRLLEDAPRAEPPIEDGGGLPGCWRAYIDIGENNLPGSWHHRFNPLWCGNGSIVTYVDPSWHYQTTSGLYSTHGVSRWHIGGCVGCYIVRYHAQARFGFHWPGGYESFFNQNMYVTLHSYSGWFQVS